MKTAAVQLDQRRINLAIDQMRADGFWRWNMAMSMRVAMNECARERRPVSPAKRIDA